jgi:hypothetical protein
MIFSENRFPLFGIMPWPPADPRQADVTDEKPDQPIVRRMGRNQPGA